MDDKTMMEEYEPETAKMLKWSEFVEHVAAEFFTGHKLEKLSFEDGGNKNVTFLSLPYGTAQFSQAQTVGKWAWVKVGS